MVPRILVGFCGGFGFFRSTNGAFFHVTFSSGLECFVGFSNVSSASRDRYCDCAIFQKELFQFKRRAGEALSNKCISVLKCDVNSTA